jgi:signal transduction histidine kinase
MSGVISAAEAQDVNLVCFIGGRLGHITSAGTVGASFGFYDLLRPEQFDGILLAADIGHGLAQEEINLLCRSLGSTPVASFAIPGEGVSAFMADGTGGMRTVIRHLIEEHGYKRIAFIRGMQGQVEAEQRFKAYQDELKAHNIRYDEKLVVEGDFTPESGRAAIRTLLDERGLRFEAVAASNDRMAFGAMEALQQRGVAVPDAIALTGFDDVNEAQSLGVPLTTVRQSFKEAGFQVFDALMKRISGIQVPALNVLPADIVVRWSCGCLPESVKQAIVLPKEVAQTGRLENKRDAAVRALLAAAGIPESDPDKAAYRDVFARTWDVFLASLGENDKSDAFLKMIQSMVEVLQRYNHEVTTWHNIISTFRKYALGGIKDHNVILRAENLFQQARMLVGELSQRAQAIRRLQFVQQEDALGNFGFSMAPAITLEEIGDAISRNFPILGLKRWYVMFFTDVNVPGSQGLSAPESFRLLMQFEENKFLIPRERSTVAAGRLVPEGKTPQDRRYTAMVMPLTLASNRFGYMWAEMSSPDWDVYIRVKNLLSSALLRTMLVGQREQAQKEVERLLNEAREHAVELAGAKDVAEKAAAQNARLFESEQARRRGAEALARSSRLLSSLTTIDRIPLQILEQLKQLLPFDRAVLFMQDVNGIPNVRAHLGFSADMPVNEIQLRMGNADFYESVARKGETLMIADVDAVAGWAQPAWLPRDRSWLGIPLYSKDNVIGLLALARTRESFNEDDGLLAMTFGMQAAVAWENARLYDEVTGINQMMERMVAQRVEELNVAYKTLDKHDKNKSAFIQVAAHELRTPLTVIKGYLGMLKADETIQASPALAQAIEGVLQGENRLHQIVNSMLDVARLDSQVLNPHVEPVSLGLILRLVHKDYVNDLATRNLSFQMDEGIKDIPPVLGDSELLKKALDHVIVNAIKFTPDGGTINISVSVVKDRRMGECAEICVKDSGIGIDAEHHKIIFEKLYQLGKVELHSSSRTNFKGGGAGLGLAIASGIVKSLQGSIWVESSGYDETKLSGSTFFIRLPLAK